MNVLKTYQKQRLTTFINPPADCRHRTRTATSWIRALIALGSGQKTGRGAGQGHPDHGRLHPGGRQDDFVFAALGETYGFAGAAIVLSLYALLIWRTLRIVTMAKNLYGTLIAGAILAMFMFQIFLTIGMNLGIMPVTGIPLPLHGIRRLIGNHNFHSHRPAAVDPRPSSDVIGRQGEGSHRLTARGRAPPRSDRRHPT